MSALIFRMDLDCLNTISSLDCLLSRMGIHFEMVVFILCQVEHSKNVNILSSCVLNTGKIFMLELSPHSTHSI